MRARSKEFGELVKHAGEEFILVLEGQVEVHTEPSIADRPQACLLRPAGTEALSDR